MPNTLEGSSVKTNFEKASFPEKPVESAVPIKAELKFDRERPVAIEVSEKVFPVECYEKEFTAQEFFSNTVRRKEDGSIESITFYNPVARKYVRDLMSFYIGDNLRDISKNLAMELQLESDAPPGKYEGSFQQKLDQQYNKAFMKAIRSGFPYRDEGKVKTIARGIFENEPSDLPNVGDIPMLGENWFSDKQEDILGWINQLVADDVRIRDTIFKVKTGEGDINLYRTTIGAIDGSPEQKYSVEQDVLKTMFFCKEHLRLPLRKKLEIFDTSVFSDANSTELSSDANHFMRAGGMSYKSKIFINTTAKQEVTSIGDTDEGVTLVNGETLVNRRRQSIVASHEIAHFMDRTPSTYPQREGLATAVEWGFDFNTSLRRLRGYRNEITADRIRMLMSKDPPENLTPAEVYGVSASFFCWLYKELGSDNFASFYNRLSGGAARKYEETSLKNKVLGPLDSAPDLEWKGNLDKALDSLPHDYRWTWANTDELLNSYISDIESRKRN